MKKRIVSLLLTALLCLTVLSVPALAADGDTITGTYSNGTVTIEETVTGTLMEGTEYPMIIIVKQGTEVPYMITSGTFNNGKIVIENVGTLEAGTHTVTIRNDTSVVASGPITVSAPPTTTTTPTYYSVTAPKETEHGTVKVQPASASAGTTVTVTATPDEGYEVGFVTVRDSSGKALELKDNGDGTYTFAMPSSGVTVEAGFAVKFTDVPPEQFYARAVAWASAKGITTGTEGTKFEPNAITNRAQVVTFLWRTAGSPEPAADAMNPFTDLDESQYYYKAVLWAVEKGITTGRTATTFAPYDECERSEIVTFLHRYAGSPEASGSTTAFEDVADGAYYTEAVRWAESESITTGITPTTFDPIGACSRGQTVTFLFRAFAE